MPSTLELTLVQQMCRLAEVEENRGRRGSKEGSGGTEMKSGQVAFGLFTLIVGVGIGYFMYTRPEGLNPEWPLEMALIVPAVFVLGGFLLIAEALDQTRLSIAMIRAMLFCFWAIVHWAAFFTNQIQCRATVSFLGAVIAGWHPSEMECRNSLRIIIGSLDALVVMAVGVFAWQRYQARRKELMRRP